MFSGGVCRARVVMKLRRFVSPTEPKKSFELPPADPYSPLSIKKIELHPSTGECLSSGSSLEIVREDSLIDKLAALCQTSP